jgi:ATP-dependent Clp protease ATP-binding subunit ClpC
MFRWPDFPGPDPENFLRSTAPDAPMVEAGLLIFSLLCAGALCLALFRYGSASERGRQLERELSLLREQLEAERLRAQQQEEAVARRPEVAGAQAATSEAVAAPGAGGASSPGVDDAAVSGAGVVDEGDLNALAWSVEEFFNRTSHPRELLAQENFEKGVALLAGEAYTNGGVMNYARGTSVVLACMAFEALARRATAHKDEGVADQIVHSLNSLYHWPRYFALRALEANAEGPTVARLLASLGADWVDYFPLSMLREFVGRRVAAGERVTGEELAEHAARANMSEEQLDHLANLLSELAGALPPTLAADFGRWRAERVDVEFLKSFGRVWEAGAGGEDAEEGGAQPEAMWGRVSELEAALRREPPRSSILVGESGVGKTATVRALARRLQKDGWTVFEAGAGEVLSGQQYIGQLEGRVQSIVRQLGGRRVLWVVPNFHETLWAGRHQYSPVGLLDMLLPHVESGALRLVGEVPAGAYEQLMRLRPKLRTAVQTCHVPPLGDAETLELGRRWAARLAATDGGGGRTPSSTPSPRVGEETLREAFQLAKQYLGDKAAPGNLLLFLEATQRRLAAEDEGPALSRGVTLDDLLVTLSQLTGLPVSILDEREGLDLSELRAFFERRVLGQPEAVDCLVERVAMVKAGLTDPTRPQGVFLFVGPTGTGKTEIAKTLAEFLFGSPERMIRLDMSEFQSPDSLDRILGEASETSDSAALVNSIRKQPFSVVLLDEFEKAHPQVWDLFLQVFDDGRLTDRRGNTADFRHCVVIMTSNLGATLPAGVGIGFSQEQAEFAAGSVERAVSKAFRREFVNRLDRVVVFRPLGLGVMRDLLRKELNDVLNRRGLRTRQWAVEWDESAIEFLLQKGFTADLGARPLKRAVERYLLSPLAMTIVNHQFPEGDQFLFVRSSADGASIEVQFVDPDAAEGSPEAGAAAPELLEESAEEEGRELRLESIALDARGTAEEIRFLQQRFRELSSEVESDEWRRRKASALDQTQAEGFWTSPGRFAVLGLAEYMDRIEAGLDTAGRLLARLGRAGARDRQRLPQELVGRLAEQLYLLEAASRGLAAGEPREAFLLVEASREAGTDAASSDRFARRVAAMYRRWAERRRMRLKVLEERDGAGGSEDDGAGPSRYRALLAVSGYGAHTILSPEAGLHVLETPQDEKSFNRAKVLVRVAGQPDEPAGHAPGALLRQAEHSFDAEEQNAPTVVRSYREEPSPLVRDRQRGWRTGKLERVLGGDFDLIT